MIRDTVSLGLLLKKRRTELGMTRVQLGEKLGINSCHQLRGWEEGKTCPQVASLKKLASVLEVPMEDLAASLYGLSGAEQISSAMNEDVLPILKLVLQSKCGKVTCEDLLFLIEIREQLPNPLSLALVAELLRNRHQDSGK